jgi:hypothetical protein
MKTRNKIMSVVIIENSHDFFFTKKAAIEDSISSKNIKTINI